MKAFNEKFFEVGATTAHFLCGPLGMIESVTETLESLGTPKEKIHFELFNTTAAGAAKKEVSSSASGASAVTVILDGEETHFEATGKEFILDAALDAEQMFLMLVKVRFVVLVALRFWKALRKWL